jgi:hypothetical protein
LTNRFDLSELVGAIPVDSSDDFCITGMLRSISFSSLLPLLCGTGLRVDDGATEPPPLKRGPLLFALPTSWSPRESFKRPTTVAEDPAPGLVVPNMLDKPPDFFSLDWSCGGLSSDFSFRFST